jgi:hypothetical protein
MPARHSRALSVLYGGHTVPNITLMTVCLSRATPVGDIGTAARAALAARGLTDAGPAGHFLTATRLRTGRLLQPWDGTAAGGPIGLLDLARMREHAHQQYGNRWLLWQHVVAGSPVARPWWHFYDRHTANPGSYTFDHAVQGFLNQPRITRMRTYNSHPGRLAELPIEHLDAFEAGAQAYATYGWLAAVPGHKTFTLDGGLLLPASVRHTDQLTYLQHANAHLAAMAPADHLVALATR